MKKKRRKFLRSIPNSSALRFTLTTRSQSRTGLTTLRKDARFAKRLRTSVARLRLLNRRSLMS